MEAIIYACVVCGFIYIANRLTTYTYSFICTELTYKLWVLFFKFYENCTAAEEYNEFIMLHIRRLQCKNVF